MTRDRNIGALCAQCLIRHTPAEWRAIVHHSQALARSARPLPAVPDRGHSGRALALALALAAGFLIAALGIGWIYLVSAVAP